MHVDPATAAAHRHTHSGDDYFFCSQACAEAFDVSARP
jgi:YHS domain-containing protein